MMCYSVVACESRATEFLPPSILSAELALPVVASCFVTRSQAALHLLGCLDTLTQAQDHRFTVGEESDDKQAGCGKVYSREDFAAVTRFESKLLTHMQCEFE
jgi:E3 ubiquitin-protein ligase MYCBP2